MDIFPIGEVSASTSSGTIDSVSYSMFEPNVRAYSRKEYINLVTTFQNKNVLTRKKADPFLHILYEYDNIFAREYRQIADFVDEMDEVLTSFWVVDWSMAHTPTSVIDASGDWTAAIDNTRLFSTTANMKSWKAFFWDGVNWKVGNVDSISANTSITVDVDGDDYGGLTLANANLSANVYPIYQCYCAPNTMQSFKTTYHIKGDVSVNKDGGYMYSGNIAFTSKYRV